MYIIYTITTLNVGEDFEEVSSLEMFNQRVFAVL